VGAVVAGFVAVAGVFVGVGELTVLWSDVHAATLRSSTSAIGASIQVFRFIPAPCFASGLGERTPTLAGEPPRGQRLLGNGRSEQCGEKDHGRRAVGVCPAASKEPSR
jgi:hypothetical protein